MGIFQKKKPAPPVSPAMQNLSPSDRRVAEFGAEILKCMMQKGKIATTEISELRAIARAKSMTQDEILKSKVFLTKFLIDSMRKSGVAPDAAKKLAAAVIIDLSRI